jgi:hypothetical protein
MDLRKVQRQDPNLYWHDIDFKDIKEGNIFRMFESTGEPVYDNKGETEFVADCDAYTNIDGIWTVDIM